MIDFDPCVLPLVYVPGTTAVSVVTNHFQCTGALFYIFDDASTGKLRLSWLKKKEDISYFTKFIGVTETKEKKHEHLTKSLSASTFLKMFLKNIHLLLAFLYHKTSKRFVQYSTASRRNWYDIRSCKKLNLGTILS